MRWAENSDETVWAVYIRPVLDYVARLAELIALAAAFRVLADQVDSFVLDALAFSLIFVVGGYVGVPMGLLYHGLNKLRLKSLWKVVLVAVPVGSLIGWGTFQISIETSRAIKELGTSSDGR